MLSVPLCGQVIWDDRGKVLKQKHFSHFTTQLVVNQAESLYYFPHKAGGRLCSIDVKTAFSFCCYKKYLFFTLPILLFDLAEKKRRRMCNNPSLACRSICARDDPLLMHPAVSCSWLCKWFNPPHLGAESRTRHLVSQLPFSPKAIYIVTFGQHIFPPDYICTTAKLYS